jgi:hypothetical protein
MKHHHHEHQYYVPRSTIFPVISLTFLAFMVHGIGAHGDGVHGIGVHGLGAHFLVQICTMSTNFPNPSWDRCYHWLKILHRFRSWRKCNRHFFVRHSCEPDSNSSESN